MLSIPEALDRIKGRVTESLPQQLIEQICHEVGHSWRDRNLGPVITTQLFVQQILHGNTACSHLRHLSGLSFTDSAYCQARARLPLKLLEGLQRAVTLRLLAVDEQQPAETSWLGHRVFLIDGSSFSMPDTPALQKHFGQPGAQADGCGFPVAHLMVLFDAAEGYLLKTLALPLRTHDVSQVAAMHAALTAGDVLVGDRAFGSFAHLALCQRRGIHGVFRAHQKQIIDFRPGRQHLTQQQQKKGQTGRPSSRWLRRLGPHDQLVEYFKPKRPPAWMTAEEYAQLPAAIVVRELRYTITEPGRRTRVVTLVTTLLDPERYPAAELARLYGLRWRVETNLKHLKQTMKMDILRCETVEGVLKELNLFVLVYNLVRRVMQEAGRQQQVPPDRISFIDAWRWLQQARPEDDLPRLIVNPVRPGRAEPRVRKRRPKEFPVMKLPRTNLRKALFRKQRAA
jgi:hypothetical protein